MKILQTTMYGLCLAVGLMLTQPTDAAPKSSRSNSKLVNFDVAVATWRLEKEDKETTNAWKRRVNNKVLELLNRTPEKFQEEDSDFFTLQTYFSKLPIKEIPNRWRDFYLAKRSNLRLPKEHMEYYLEQIKKKKLYEMSPKEVDAYLPVAYKEYPDMRDRIMHYAHKNLGQPYNMYLLGEFPFELYDSSPLYNLAEGDCVVFSEHMYAMTLSRNWKEFMQNLMKIRYKDGKIGYVTRNHYTEADWVKNNTWLIEDMTEKLGATRTVPYTERIDRQGFFAKYGIETTIPVEMLQDSYIPYDAIESVLPNLKKGDFVNIARGREEGKGVYIGHVGLVGELPDGTKTFIHSTWPKSKEQPLVDYVKRGTEGIEKKIEAKQVHFVGFKFHRLRAEDLQKKLNETPVLIY